MRLTLSYQTQQLPAPYAYMAVLQANFDANQIEVSLEINYLEREELSEAEILAEGFSNHDDFSWSGSLPNVWFDELKSFESLAVLPDPDITHYLHVSWNDQPLGFPVEIESAQRTMQELVQAIYEVAGHSAVLSIGFNDQQTSTLSWSFANRSIQINGSRSANWEAGSKILDLIYELDFEQLTNSKKAKSQSIQPDNDLWYQVPSDTWKVLMKLVSEL